MGDPSISLPEPPPTENDSLFDGLLDKIVYVGNVPKETQLTDLTELFRYAGPIKRVAWSGENRIDINTKIAFIRFRTDREAKEATQWDRVRYKDSVLVVMLIGKEQWLDMSVTITVRNIRDDTSDWQLYEAFRRFGKIYAILIPSHGTAYVGFYYEEHATRALEMDNNMFNGNRMRVAMLRRNLPLQQVDILDRANNEIRLLRAILLEEDEKLEQFYTAYETAFKCTPKDYRKWKRRRRRMTPLLVKTSSESDSSDSYVSVLSDRSSTDANRIQFGTTEENRCLGIFGMSPDTTEKTLMKLFTKFGGVNDIKLIYDGKTNVSRGYSFIYFDHASDAREAQRKLNGTMLDGRKVRVDFSRSKPHEARCDRRKRSPPASTSFQSGDAEPAKKRTKQQICYSSSDSD